MRRAARVVLLAVVFACGPVAAQMKPADTARPRARESGIRPGVLDPARSMPSPTWPAYAWAR